MAKPEITHIKSDCWQSPWRGVGVAANGRPLRYLLLNMEEMLIAAKTGVIRVPDSQIPTVVRRQRDRLKVLSEHLAVEEPLLEALARRVSLA